MNSYNSNHIENTIVDTKNNIEFKKTCYKILNSLRLKYLRIIIKNNELIR